MLCMEPGRNITLHSKDIEIQNKTVTVQDEQSNSVGISRYVKKCFVRSFALEEYSKIFIF